MCDFGAIEEDRLAVKIEADTRSVLYCACGNRKDPERELCDGCAAELEEDAPAGEAEE